MNATILVLLLIAVLSLLLYVLYRYFSLKAEIDARAKAQYEAWKATEIESLRQHHEEIANQRADLQLQQWQEENTKLIRKEAIEKSRAVTLGKVTEHVVPYLPGFQHNPKDARFIGAPVDFIVFDGLDAGAVQQITFVEVKTGSSSLSKRERQIRDAIKQRSVEWEELRIPTEEPRGSPAEKETLPAQDHKKLCPDCGKENRRQASFCGSCGSPLDQEC